MEWNGMELHGMSDTSDRSGRLMRVSKSIGCHAPSGFLKAAPHLGRAVFFSTGPNSPVFQRID